MIENILLTGCNGYLGSKFVEKFSNYYQIYGFDTNFFDLNKKVSSNLGNLIQKDIRNLTTKDLENIDCVIHMAELSNDPLGELNSELTYEINHQATINLLSLMEKTNIKKFIYMSSCSVYGYNEKTVTEKSELNPITTYAKAKVRNESYILENDFSFKIAILRNATAFGYSPNIRLDLVINDLVYSAIKNSKIELLSDGKPKRPFVHVEDICNIIEHLIKNDKYEKLLLNIGTNELNFSIIEIAKKIAEFTNISNISIGKSNADDRSYDVNFDLLKNFLPNYEFVYDLDNGILDLIEHFSKYIDSYNSRRLEKIKFLIRNKEIDEMLYWN